MFPGLDLYHADPAQPLKTTGEELDDLDHDLDHDLSVRGAEGFALGGLPNKPCSQVSCPPPLRYKNAFLVMAHRAQLSRC